MTEERARILLIDDTPANIQILYELFHREYGIFFATSGRDGLAIARRELPDLILLDVMMPGMDGYETCGHLKSDPLTAGIPVIFVTAMGDEEDETRGLATGAIDYLTKPISPPIVKARVRNHLELKRGRDQLEKVGLELAAKHGILEKERMLAHDLLSKILPDRLCLRGFRTEVHFRPSDRIGGDFFDGWNDGDNAHFLIGDISGHSISAALLMAVCKGLFMSLGQGNRDPGAIVAAANRILCRMLIDSGMYLTLIYLYCDRQRGVVRLVSAGHCTAYLYGAAGRTGLESTGPPLGWDPDDSWEVSEYSIVGGDTIVLYTDGLVETRNGQGMMRDDDPFAGLDPAVPLDEMVADLLAAAESFCDGRFDDDVTLFAIRCDDLRGGVAMEQTVTFSLSPDFSSVDTIRREVGLALQGWFDGRVDGGAISDFCQAICELVNNAVEHGECTVLEATLLLEPRAARFVLETDGEYFDTAASTASMPEIDGNGNLPDGGFGLALIRNLSDGIRYQCVDGRNVTEIVKHFEEV